jgi:hypothetical protein
MSCSRVPALLTRALVLAVLLSACATAGNESTDQSDSDGSDSDSDGTDTPTIDAGVVFFPDAAGFVDASVPVEVFDAAPGTPDAAVPPPMIDAAVPPPTCSPCKLIAQCGCPTDQACDLSNLLGATGCRTVNPLPGGKETTACTTAAQCAAGYSCYGLPTSDRACRKYCSADSQCAGGGSQGGKCVLEVLGAGNATIPNPEHPQNRTFTCSPACDPAGTSGCPASFACEVDTVNPGSGFVDFTSCRKAGNKGHYQTCASVNDCATGTTCIDIGSAGSPDPVCLNYCQVGGNGCDLFESCATLQDNQATPSPFVIGGTTWGVCVSIF